MYKNKILLITGGTGSFGNAVLKRFIGEFKEIRIFSRDEKKQDDMRIQLRNNKVKFYIGDVRNRSSVDNVMQGVDYVFHAAALKQVPSCEFFPMEATKTNVLGTNNVVESAIFHKVKKVICLSTDKAAYPINAMGISKALMEKVAISSALHDSETTICVTRYGNVMASRGSVIPLFTKQILNNEPVTITDPKMTRFLMSLDDAVDLVLFAFNNGCSGDLFVNKAPACNIGDLAEALKLIFKSDSEIKIIGTRHGEIHYETLCTRDLNYNQYFSEGSEMKDVDDYNSNNTNQLNINEVKEILLKLDFIDEILKNK